MTVGPKEGRDSLGRKKRKTVIRNQTFTCVHSFIGCNNSVLFVVTKNDPIVLVTRQFFKCGEWRR